MENLKSLIQINSYENKDEIIEYLKDYFSDKVSDIKIIKNNENNNKNIIIGINTQLNNICPILLSGHIDTVTPDFVKYNTNPLELVEVEDKCYGLGTIDMKSFTAVIMDKLEDLKNIQYPIIVCLTIDEETDFCGIKNVIKQLGELNIKPTFTIVGEPTNSQFNTTSKGCFEYEVEVYGKSCHSSMVDKGINAINILSRIMIFIEEEQRKYNDLTSNCGIISGGTILNRVPDYAKLTFDVRTLNTDVNVFIEAIKQQNKKLEQMYTGSKISLTQKMEVLPLKNKNEQFINELAKFIDVNIGDFSGGCEAGYYQAYSGDAIIFGVGDLALAHKPNEYVVKTEYYQYSKKLIQLIRYLSCNLKNYQS
jgi:acetylornithine deacetylase